MQPSLDCVLSSTTAARARQLADVFALFHTVIESSREGIRKPDPRICRRACERLGIQPQDAVFLDDLGINLKPARELGMTPIKVTSESQAIAGLEAILGIRVPQ